MGFWDLFTKNKLPHKSPDSVIAELAMDDDRYILKEFDISFRQKTDDNSKPEGDVYFESIKIRMESQPANQLFDWAASGKIWEYGEVNFYSCNETITRGSLLKISFQKARCLKIDRNTSLDKENRTTLLVIAPHSITIGNETIERRSRN
ncbi:hypothetical protein DW228_18415 [Bacteroides fragilis]|uniref:Type VI secretion system needle protein Hcp n=1 Tax=Bacteroides fragilis TaxID=817 RepID=A0A396BU41_BACFG|nr:type VI secretion system tube protein TssD [Bacteroides fragilis]RHH07908.1 hypothetical protein DW228_18415 [Bacteroides fragilis]